MTIKKDYDALVVVLWHFITSLRKMARIPNSSKADFYAIFIFSVLMAFAGIAHAMQSALMFATKVAFGAGRLRVAGGKHLGIPASVFGPLKIKGNARATHTINASQISSTSIPVEHNKTPLSDFALSDVMSPLPLFPIPNDLLAKLWDASHGIATHHHTVHFGEINTITPPATPALTASPSSDISRSSSYFFEALSYPVTPRKHAGAEYPFFEMYEDGEDAQGKEMMAAEIKGRVWF